MAERWKTINTVTEIIKRHQVVAFFVLTFAISWGLWIPFLPLVFSGQQPLLTPLVIFAAFGPAMAGMVVTSIIDLQPRQGSRKGPWVAFVVAWILATLIFILHLVLRTQVDLSPPLVAMSALTALSPAFVVSSAFSRVPGVRNYLASLVKPRGGISWYLVAILLLPVVQLLGVALMRALGQEVWWRPIQTKGGVQLASMVAFAFVYQVFYANCLGEEVGWRGFALPKLQTRYSPLVASIIIGFLWVLWHFPYWQVQLGSFNSKYMLFASGITLAYSFIFTWLYNRTGGSILAVGLMHVSGNLSGKFVQFIWIWPLLMMLLAFIVIVADKMWQMLPSDSHGGLDSIPRK